MRGFVYTLNHNRTETHSEGKEGKKSFKWSDTLIDQCYETRQSILNISLGMSGSGSHTRCKTFRAIVSRYINKDGSLCAKLHSEGFQGVEISREEEVED